MTDYKIARVPMPIDKIREMRDSFLKSKTTKGGFSVRYRMPKEMVKLVNEDTGAGADETYGMGLGKAARIPLLLQGRQMDGLLNAKGKGAAYNLVLSKKQLKAMNGQGIFGDILGALIPTAVNAISGLFSGSKPRGRGGEEDGEGCGAAGKKDYEICPHCEGSGFLPLLLPLIEGITSLFSKGKGVDELPAPRKQKNLRRPPQIGM